MKAEYDLSQGQRGAVIPQTGKTRITIWIDDDIIEAFREQADAAGRGYQSMINDALRTALANTSAPLDAKIIRRIMREELQRLNSTV